MNHRYNRVARSLLAALASNFNRMHKAVTDARNKIIITHVTTRKKIIYDA
jgi:hypothetical protein